MGWVEMTSLWISCILPKNNSLRISAGKKTCDQKKKEKERKKENSVTCINLA